MYKNFKKMWKYGAGEDLLKGGRVSFLHLESTLRFAKLYHAFILFRMIFSHTIIL